MRLTRDSAVWWLGIASALLAYLGAAPAQSTWDYPQWIQFAALVVATVSGKLATSPLAGDQDAADAAQE